VTIADLRVQKTIEENFKHFFPTLITRGEETAQSLENISSQVLPSEIDIDFIKEELLQESFAKRE